MHACQKVNAVLANANIIVMFYHYLVFYPSAISDVYMRIEMESVLNFRRVPMIT